MDEIGGYIEFERNHKKMLHENAIKLNCGRRAFSYILESRNIKKIWIPRFTCASVIEPCIKRGVEYRLYSIGMDFLPNDKEIDPRDWVYIINYYGQISNDKISRLRNRFPKTVVDNAQAYFQMPNDDVDTFYTCRKFFGVADGAILYSSSRIEMQLDTDESYQRMTFLMGRYERNASEFYELYNSNNEMFDNEQIKKMSLLTMNILKGIDYENVKDVRTRNFEYLHEHLGDMNKLDLTVPEGAYMYPLYINGGDIVRKRMIEKRIYIPILWPDVFNISQPNSIEYDMARNILPLPVDQRYGGAEMERIVREIRSLSCELSRAGEDHKDKGYL